MSEKDLLIWNPKDGWEPLCSFLNLPQPNATIPILNQTADKGFFAKFFLGRLSTMRILRMTLTDLFIKTIVYVFPLTMTYLIAKLLFDQIIKN